MKLNKCSYCGNKIQIPLRPHSTYKIAYSIYLKRKFCSLECKYKVHSLSLKGESNGNWKGGKSKCIDCGTLLPVRYSWKEQTRCKPCFYKFNSGSNHKNWKGGSYCLDCNKEIWHGQERCRKCYGISVTGSQSVRYVANPTNYKYLHIVIRRTLGNPQKCLHCGLIGQKINNRWNIEFANKTGKYLRDPSDWLALCRSCHRKYDNKKKDSS